MLEIIKVCGITSLADALFAARHGATAVGFVFYDGSPRCVRVETAAQISTALPQEVLRVGVFVNESADRVRAAVEAAQLGAVQLHGGETPEYCASLGEAPVWKAFPVREPFQPEMIEPYDCEAYLLDTAAPDGSFGGSGRTFRWAAAREAKRQGRIILAGGLDGDNVAAALREAQPWGVDSSSKLEREPGVKDPGKVLRYLRAAREAAEFQ